MSRLSQHVVPRRLVLLGLVPHEILLRPKLCQQLTHLHFLLALDLRNLVHVLLVFLLYLFHLLTQFGMRSAFTLEPTDQLSIVIDKTLDLSVFLGYGLLHFLL